MISIAIQNRLRSALLPPRLPSMLAWAEATVRIPDGPRRGEPFRADVQPFSRLLLSEIDSGRWDRIVVTGPTQSGKSLIAYVVPCLFHLLAIGETVVAGLPTSDMSEDKWREDFLPVIEVSPALRRMLPIKGQGSRSGRVRTRVKFRNGATLRFMSFGGNDKVRAGFTARVLAITEVDGADSNVAKSKEADKIKQLEGRQRAYLKFGIRSYLESTVSLATGRIWQEYIGGTESRIARPCPHCGDFVSPDRDCLVGWSDAPDELQARANAAWSCPTCGETWTEAERYAANLRSVLVHRGQQVNHEGAVIGPVPATRTLGFRWSAVDNHFATAGDIAADEWRGAREIDRVNSEKELRQFVHCLPYDPPEIELTPLDAARVISQASTYKRGIAPLGCVGITIGLDTGKRILQWTAIGWLASGAGFIVDYGKQTVAADLLGIVTVHRSLSDLGDFVLVGLA